jgi:ArsR family transcriptional regulator
MSAIPVDQLAASCAISVEPGVDATRVLPLLKLMSEPNRLKIFALLAGGERCVCEIEEHMKLPQNLVSHHLGVLRDAGYIRARRAGRWVYYSVNKETLAAVYPTLCHLFNPECVNDMQKSCQAS